MAQHAAVPASTASSQGLSATTRPSQKGGIAKNNILPTSQRVHSGISPSSPAALSAASLVASVVSIDASSQPSIETQVTFESHQTVIEQHPTPSSTASAAVVATNSKSRVHTILSGWEKYC